MEGLEVGSIQIEPHSAKRARAYLRLFCFQIAFDYRSQGPGGLQSPNRLLSLRIAAQLHLCQIFARRFSGLAKCQLFECANLHTPGTAMRAILQKPGADHAIAYRPKAEPKTRQLFVPIDFLFLVVRELETSDRSGIELYSH